jgi:uncharacterized tellurite resistance protein B-like protein
VVVVAARALDAFAARRRAHALIRPLTSTPSSHLGDDVPMQLIDLLPDESLALVALSRAIARADGAISPLEGRAIALMAAELGEATYRKLFAKAAESFPDQAALQQFLATIERPEARSLIYESILALASADSISAEEEPLMIWLQEAWEIQ